ncbi:hypothetical protein [Acinetobacter sp. YH12145]|uniref:hypothetical protein n=1 Tax=Acinetobacter sp. YH12145 TaxID=2601129 RepID=UPI0015D2D060|nr:hypothetical protein [Acinetobacter sp. YH12145]
MSEQQYLQSHILQETKSDLIKVELYHSTDWVVAASILVSALISVFAFFVTICIVKRSTQSQIESNVNLINAQSELKVKELRTIQKLEELKEFRAHIVQYIAEADRFRFLYTQNFYYAKPYFLLPKSKNYQIEFLSCKEEFRRLTYSVIMYLKALDQTQHELSLKLLELQLLGCKMTETETDEKIHNKLTEEFIKLHQQITFILRVFLEENYGQTSGSI